MTSNLRSRAASLRGRLPQHRQSTPPAEQGRRLATIARPKDDAEIRLCWCEYEGHPYLSIRVWAKGDDGQMWPDKHRGFSVRLRELPDVAEAIAEALDLAEQHQAQWSQRQPHGGAPRAQADGSGGAAGGNNGGGYRRAESGGQFDEFGG
jgi:hypothetical protein